MAEDAAELGGSESARHYYFNSTDDRGLRSSYVKRTLSRDSSYRMQSNGLPGFALA